MKMKHCLFCNISSEPLRKLYEWDKPEQYNWYCETHYYSVKGFQEEQKRKFIDAFSHPNSYENLPVKSKELYDRLTKK